MNDDNQQKLRYKDNAKLLSKLRRDVRLSYI